MNLEANSERVTELIATELRWAKAHRELNLDTIVEILSDEYRHIQADGSVIGKDQLLKSYRSGERFWQIAESSEHEVQIIGEVAILTGLWRGKGVNAGKDFDYTARFLAVFVLEGRRWKLLSDVSVPLY